MSELPALVTWDRGLHDGKAKMERAEKKQVENLQVKKNALVNTHQLSRGSVEASVG